MGNLYIGIDPGQKGGMVAINQDLEPIEWIAADGGDTGAYYEGNEILPIIISDWLRGLPDGYQRLAIEQQSVRPGQGIVSGKRIGYGEGVFEGIIHTLGIVHTRPRPQEWRKQTTGHTVPENAKQKSILFCQSNFPGLPLTWGRR